ncbi:MAG: hypothetical protein JSR45_11225 [Proteobacteria bacterium]|nr:hypothetical protein [Pseudomonadota bacterium]
MSDDFLTRIQSEWREGANDVEPVRRRVRLDLWTARAVLAAEMAAAMGAFGAGVWMARYGLGHRDLLMLMGAAVLIFSLPPLAALSFLARRESLRWEDVTPEGLIDYALLRTRRAARINVLTRWHLYVLAGFLAAILLALAAGLVRPSLFLALYAALLVAIVGAGLPLLSRRARRIAAEEARCLSLKQQFEQE